MIQKQFTINTKKTKTNWTLASLVMIYITTHLLGALQRLFKSVMDQFQRVKRDKNKIKRNNKQLQLAQTMLGVDIIIGLPVYPGQVKNHFGAGEK